MARGGSDVLVSSARTGDQAAWRELYALHARRLTVWLRSLPLPDAASSPDDVAAESWLTAAAKIGEFSGSDDDFAGWLFTIARNHASNVRRTAVRRRTQPVAGGDADDETFGVTPDRSLEVDAQAGTRHLLAHLSPREAQVIACIDVVGLDVASTARALGMAPTAVRVARHRGLGRLRTILAEDVLAWTRKREDARRASAVHAACSTRTAASASVARGRVAMPAVGRRLPSIAATSSDPR